MAKQSKMIDRVKALKEAMVAHNWVEFKRSINVRGNLQIVKYCKVCGCVRKSVRKEGKLTHFYEVGAKVVTDKPYCQVRPGRTLEGRKGTVVMKLGILLTRYQKMNKTQFDANVRNFGDVYELEILIRKLTTKLFKDDSDVK